MPNRKVPPPIQEIHNITLPQPNVYHLDNGIPVYEVNAGTQDILKLEIILSAGRWYEDKQLVSRTTAALLKEGTTSRTSKAIAEKIDFYGGSLRFPVNLDTSHVVLYCLTKHFEQLLPEVQSILTEPTFPEDELIDYVKRKKNRLRIDLEKNDIVAYRQVTELMFGELHPYGYNSSIAGYEEVERADLIRHFKQHYTSDNIWIVISGKTNKDTLPLLNKYLGNPIPKGKSQRRSFDIQPHKQRINRISSANDLQTAIRIGRKMFNRHHEDFAGMYVLNTILGGYFGSRLMQNLREDKGYTYGIYSTIEPMMYDGYFYVATDVAKDVTDVTIKEIYSEFRRLREELVGKEELSMVRNYLMGNLLSALDGPFNVAEVHKTMIMDGLDTNYFNNMVEQIKIISPETLQHLAQKYLDEEKFYEVIVG